MEGTVPLQDLLALVHPELERAHRELARDLAPDRPELQPLLEHVAEYRGKQLRPAMVVLAAKAVGQSTAEHIAVAKVVELLHTATLVHDDILDEADVRRQLPTISALHGSEVSVLLGDYLYSKAFHLAVMLDDPACARELAEVARIICQGEITQLLHRFDFDWTQERYLEVIGDKTASLFAAAAKLGAHYAGATPAICQTLEAYGRAVGVAFQIVDDCLDLAGDEAVVGKSLGTDFTKGKLTLPLLYLLRAGEGDRLRALLGQDDGLERIAAEFDLEAALQFSLRCAGDQVRRATDALSPVPDGPARDALAELAQCLLRRSF